jgi:hypothetical protein
MISTDANHFGALGAGVSITTTLAPQRLRPRNQDRSRTSWAFVQRRCHNVSSNINAFGRGGLTPYAPVAYSVIEEFVDSFFEGTTTNVYCHATTAKQKTGQEKAEVRLQK